MILNLILVEMTKKKPLQFSHQDFEAILSSVLQNKILNHHSM